MNSPVFDDKVVSIVHRLTECRLPYALGGAIAYGYHGVPRSTLDIDVNVFVSKESGEAALECLAELGIVAAEPDAVGRVRRDGQVRLKWDETFVDLFFAYEEFHELCRQRAKQVQFAGFAVNILSAEDIVIFKILFNRPHDWTDIERVLRVQGEALDVVYVRDWIVAFVGEDDVRTRRLDELLRPPTSSSGAG